MKYNFYTANEIKPAGWLKRQLEVQANGLSANLDKIWPDVRDSQWIGGDRDGWERFPYWLDGFIPLAYLLDDEDMKGRAKKYAEAVASRLEEMCNEEELKDYDPWAIQLVTKALTVYCDCTKDKHIAEVLRRVMKAYYELLKSGKIKLFGWGRFRWFEAFVTLNFLYRQKHEEWLVDLGKTIKSQGEDYTTHTDKWKRPLNRWTYETHIVNICMMLKSEAVSHELLGEKYTGIADKLDDILREYNGTPTGMYTGDECLSGISPIQGTELCAVVEKMYSLEHLFAATGDNKWAEQLETICFNALPATFDDEMRAHQYVQMSNQIECKPFPGKSVFRTNDSEAHIFGLEPNFGCCTANFSQGWPKFILSAFMHNDSEIVNVLPIPSHLNDGGINIHLETKYPFESTFVYNIASNREFKFRIRIPSFAKNIKVNGKLVPNEDLVYNIAENSKTEMKVTFDAVPHFETGKLGLSAVKCGSLLFSLPVEYEKKSVEYVKDGVERKFPYCDYTYRPTSEWSYAYSDKTLTIMTGNISDIPFSSTNPPITILAKVKKINWGCEDGYDDVCAKLPQSTEFVGEEKELRLYPYGCAKLRMTELPLITE